MTQALQSFSTCRTISSTDNLCSYFCLYNENANAEGPLIMQTSVPQYFRTFKKYLTYDFGPNSFTTAIFLLILDRNLPISSSENKKNIDIVFLECSERSKY